MSVQDTGQQHPKTDDDNSSASHTWRPEEGPNFDGARKKVVGEPYEGESHVRFEVAGDGDQDKVKASEALSKETESNRSASPRSQVPSPDPTTRLG